MIKPKEIEITDIDGETKTYIIGRYPATEAQEIMYQLPVSGLPKVGDFEALKSVRNDIFKYIAVKTPDGEIVLSTKTLIDNHVNGGEAMMKLMGASLTYNYEYLGKLLKQNLFDSLSVKIQSIAMSFLQDFYRRSSGKSKRR